MRALPGDLRRMVRGLVLVAALLAHGVATGQPEIPDEDHPGFRYQALAFEAMEAEEYGKAESLFRKQLEVQPRNFVPWYNLGCALSMQGRAEEAMGAVERAIELGFSNLSHLTRDPQLQAIRALPRYREIIDNWDAILDAQADAAFELLKEQYGPRYHYEVDEALRVRFVSEHDDELFDLMRDEIDTVTRWGIEEVFFNLRPDPDRDGGRKDPWVTVIVPNERDFRRWAVSTFGPAALRTFSQIGGSYSHDRKQLVSMDIGGTLRHEFFHALHWRSCGRERQMHAIWVQEGLCSLVEDYDRTPEGGIRIARSWRTNVAHRLARNGGLMDIDQLAALPPEQFSNSNPLSNYAQARAVFLFIHESGKLGEWYRTYCETFTEDRSGIRAIEAVFGRPIAQVNEDYKAWARALEEVPDTLHRPRAKLGAETDAGLGAGLKVLSVTGAARPLRRGDVIISVNGRPVREINEFYRVMGDYEPGETVTVRYKRGEAFHDAAIMLSP